MNRASFLAAILGALGIARGQSQLTVTKTDGCLTMGADGWIPCPPRIPKPANNECPVCGTMADPFYEEPVCTEWKPIGGAVVECTGYSNPIYPQTVICQHCNVMFQRLTSKKP